MPSASEVQCWPRIVLLKPGAELSELRAGGTPAAGTSVWLPRVPLYVHDESRAVSTDQFLLANVSEATGGHSLSANVALVENNARLGAQIAFAFSKL